MQLDTLCFCCANHWGLNELQRTGEPCEEADEYIRNAEYILDLI